MACAGHWSSRLPDASGLQETGALRNFQESRLEPSGETGAAGAPRGEGGRRGVCAGPLVCKSQEVVILPQEVCNRRGLHVPSTELQRPLRCTQHSAHLPHRGWHDLLCLDYYYFYVVYIYCLSRRIYTTVWFRGARSLSLGFQTTYSLESGFEKIFSNWFIQESPA